MLYNKFIKSTSASVSEVALLHESRNTEALEEAYIICHNMEMEEGLEDMIRRIVEESLVGMRSQSDSLPKAYLIGQKPSCPTGSMICQR